MESTLQLNVRKEDELFSLTDLWKEASCPSSKDPREWLRQETTTQLIDTVCSILNVGENHIIKTQRGKGKMQGSWAHKNIALAYAKYLDPKLHVLVNQVFFERVEEESNPELAVQRGNERASRTWKKRGKSDKWIEERISGIAGRKAFTGGLAAHGVAGNDGFRNCTNAIYTPLYGGTTSVVRYKKNLPAGASIRDNMNEVELAATRLSELLALQTIESQNLNGNGACELACSHAAKSVASALIQNKKTFQQP